MPYGVIYLIYNLVNDKVYIGQTTVGARARFKQHVYWATQTHESGLLYNAIRKYGQTSFGVQVLVICDTVDELNFYEDLFIRMFCSLAPGGYNLVPGGRFTGKHSLETKRAIGSYQECRVVSQETREKIRVANTGRLVPASERLKLSQAALGRKFTDSHKQSLSVANRGQTRTTETREKMKTRHRVHLHKGQMMSHKDIYNSEPHNESVTYKTFVNRINKGLTISDALSLVVRSKVV